MGFTVRHIADALAERPAPPGSMRPGTMARRASSPYRCPPPLSWWHRGDPLGRLLVIIAVVAAAEIIIVTAVRGLA